VNVHKNGDKNGGFAMVIDEKTTMGQLFEKAQKKLSMADPNFSEAEKNSNVEMDSKPLTRAFTAKGAEILDINDILPEDDLYFTSGEAFCTHAASDVQSPRSSGVIRDIATKLGSSWDQASHHIMH
jgi:hypothetical protein